MSKVTKLTGAGNVSYNMNLVSLVVKQSAKEAIQDALKGLGYHEFITADVYHYRPQDSITETTKSAQYIVDSFPKTKIEVFVSDQNVNDVTYAIRKTLKEKGIDGFLYVGKLNSFEDLRLDAGS